MKNNYTLFKYKNCPVLLNQSLVLVPLFFIYFNGLAVGLIKFVGFLILIVAHELGHAYFVDKYNHKLIEIKILPFHGYCKFDADPNYEIEPLIDAGGLLVQAGLVVLFLSIYLLLDYFNLHSQIKALEPIFFVFITANIVMIILNALPIKGLDGYELWRRLDWHRWPIFNKKAPNKRKKVDPAKVVDLAIKNAQKKARQKK